MKENENMLRYFRHPATTWLSRWLVALLISFCLLPAMAEDFDALRKKMAVSIATQSEANVVALLKAGVAENKISQAHSVAGGWFMQNQPKNAETIRLAAEVAELSANFPAAIAYYQQYLDKVDPKTPKSQEAVLRLYRLMVEVMGNQNNAAYLYMLNNADAFMRYGSARQFNTWFLDRASQNTADTVRFLAAVCRAGYSKAEMESTYTRYFRRVFEPDRRSVGRPNLAGDIKLAKYYTDLAKAMTHDEHYKAVFTWRGKAWGYNAAYYRAARNNMDKKREPMLIPSPPLAAAEAFLSKYPGHGYMVCEDLIETDRFGRDVRDTFNRKESERSAKIALLKKFLPTMPPMVRYRVIQRLMRYDKTVAKKGKEQAMLTYIHPNHIKQQKVRVMGGKTPKAEREAEFRKLIADFDLHEPKEKYVYNRLVCLVAGHPSCWSEMMKTEHRQWILSRAITEHLRISTTSFRTATPNWNSTPHWSEPHLRKVVGDLAAKNKLVPWITMTWINAFRPLGYKNRQHSDLKGGLPMIKKVQSLAAYKSIRPYLRDDIRRGAAFAFKVPKGYDPDAPKDDKKKKPEPVKVVPSGPFKEILALNGKSDAAAVSAAIKAVLPRVKASPSRMWIGGVDNLAGLQPKVIEDPTVMPLLLELLGSPHAVPWQHGHDQLFYMITDGLKKTPDATLLHRHSYTLWFRAQRIGHGRGYQRMIPLQDAVLPKNPSAAATLARIHVQFATEQERRNPRHKDSYKGSSISLLNRANQAMRLNVITVPESDPAYPVYKSQNEFTAGNIENAWKLFEGNAETALEMHRKLSSGYMLWVLERLIEQRNADGQERVVKALQSWRTDVTTAFSKGQSVTLDILYGDIARQRGQLENAHKIYRKIQENKDNAGVPELYTAILRRIEIERITKNFDAALQTAENLINQKIPEVWSKAHYAKALVYYDMEDYDEARDIIDAILQREPGHKDATILQGKVNVKNKALVDATILEVSDRIVQQSVVTPGERLKVTLTDPTLAVSGGGTDIEVEVWATSGDRETVLLSQFGDSKTKFRGTTRVVLGKPKSGDGVLQVIGDDKIFYAYSKRFIEKVKLKEAKQGGPLTIISNSTLMASARKLLSPEEQRALDKERIAEALGHGEATLASLTEDERAEVEAKLRSLAEKERLAARVKPGNLIYLRVVDEDCSRTAGVDALTVSVRSSSGDVVGRVSLKETETHSGVFEGILQTHEAQAMAFASSTRSGLNPNMVISPIQHKAWRSAPGKVKGTSVFTVDLNDNVALETLTISAAEAGMALKRFRLRTGMNRKELQTAATWPATPLPQNPLAPSVFIVQQSARRNGYGNPAENRPYEFSMLRDLLEKGYLIESPKTHTATVSGISQAFSKQMWEQSPWMKGATHHNHVRQGMASRFRGYFYEQDGITRYFRVVLGNAPKYVLIKGKGRRDKWDLGGKNLPCFVTVNGRPLPAKGQTYEGAIRLRAGLHRLEILSQGRPGAIGFGGRSVKLQTRVSAEDEWEDCPDSFFDSSTFPAEIRKNVFPPASITRNEKGTEWTIKFSKGARARVLSFELAEHEGPEASISKISLTSVGGKKVLPVPTDYAELTKNDTLEILTGDKVLIRYVDDRFTVKAKERQERTLHVAFTDAKAHFSDVEPRFHQYKGMQPFEERILRFRYNEPLSVVVDDADMDVSDKPDTVKIKLVTQGGKEKTFTAKETDDTNGTFRIFVTPVPGPTSKANEIQVAPGGTMKVVYLDNENVRPGIPTERKGVIEHAKFETPRLEISDMSAELGYVVGEKLYKPGEKLPRQPEETKAPSPYMWVTRKPVESGSPEAKNVTFIQGLYTDIYIKAPNLALRPSSSLKVFVQTSAGRKKAPVKKGPDGKPIPGPAFDITVPGTRMLTAMPSEGRDLRLGGHHMRQESRIFRDRPGTGQVRTGGRRRAGIIPAGTSGIFRARLGVFPDTFPTPGTDVDTGLLLRYATAGTRNPLKGKQLEQFLEKISYTERLKRWVKVEELGRELKRCKLQDPIVVMPGDRVFIGLRYEDESGKVHWQTASAKVITHGGFTVSFENNGNRSREHVTLGDRVRVQVEDYGFDKTDDLDTVKVDVASKSGVDTKLELKETEPHSGVFEGSFLLKIAEGATPENLKIGTMGFPATYGDTIAIRYKESSGLELPIKEFSLGVGSNGDIVPFTKRYGDDETAITTQFSMAEAHLEVAKRYRKLKATKKAELSYQRAKQLLASTIDRFKDPETRAHAEYLLGNLTYEEAGTTADQKLREERYQAALARFIKVTTNYPDTTYAAKAQFKKAVTYERLKEPDIAAQEYVKLAYKYPDSEYLATAMYRLGAHFLVKAKKVKRELKPLIPQVEGKEPKDVDKDVMFKYDRLTKDMNEHYIKSGKIFARLIDLFPTHELAAQGGLRAGQTYYYAQKYDKSLANYKKVYESKAYDGVARAEALYWAGRCYNWQRQYMAAYSVFMRCTEDYPETKWSGYCLSELAKPRLKAIDVKMNEAEIKKGMDE